MKTPQTISNGMLAQFALGIFLFANANSSIAQSSSSMDRDAVAQLSNLPIHNSETRIYTEPKFDRAADYISINDFIAKEIAYPEYASITGASGEMVVRFEIKPNGGLGTVQIHKSPGAEFDKAVLDAIKKMPRWTAATRDGKAVVSTYELRLNFRLQ